MDERLLAGAGVPKRDWGLNRTVSTVQGEELHEGDRTPRSPAGNARAAGESDRYMKLVKMKQDTAEPEQVSPITCGAGRAFPDGLDP